MSTGKGLRAVARWPTSEGLLGQFSLAKEQRDWVEGKRKGSGDEDEEEGLERVREQSLDNSMRSEREA